MTSAMTNLHPISLDQMGSVKLMNRIDTKYVASEHLLPDILQQAQTNYYIQEIDNQRIEPYDTLYYDTPDLQMYLTHHNRHLQRQKIRIRTYLNTQQTFLEVKNKNNKGRTKKKRIPLNTTNIHAITSDQYEWLSRKSWYDIASLLPQLHTRFERITLVNRALTERITIDTNLRWQNMQTGLTAALGPLLILELKRDGNQPSEMLHILADLRIKPLKISKYCIGTALTNPNIKTNRFKPKIRLLQKWTD